MTLRRPATSDRQIESSTLCFAPDFSSKKPSFFQLVGLGLEFLPPMRHKCFYKDSQAQIIGSRLFALTRTRNIQRLRSPQLRYHVFKGHDGSTIQVMIEAVRLSIFLCAFDCEIGTASG